MLVSFNGFLCLSNGAARRHKRVVLQVLTDDGELVVLAVAVVRCVCMSMSVSLVYVNVTLAGAYIGIYVSTALLSRFNQKQKTRKSL